MDSVLVNCSELVGKSQSKTAALEALIKGNALNRTGNVDYNKYGKLDGIGFEKVSDKFVDNFLLFVLVKTSTIIQCNVHIIPIIINFS